MLKAVYRWGPALAVMLLIFIASAQPEGSALMPDFGGLRDLIIKKGGHLLFYALLGAALLHGLSAEQAPSRPRALAALLLALLYAVSDEFHQTFVPGREGRWQDVVIDTVGATFGLIVYAALFVRSRSRLTDSGNRWA